MSDTTTPPKHYLLWIDVETTAVKPEDGQLLEVGVAITNMEGTVLYGPKSIVIKRQRLELNDDTKHAILGMHTANDLINQVLVPYLPKTVEFQCKPLLDDLCAQLAGAKEAGCTIHVAGTNVQFDIDWLTKAELWSYFEPYVSHRRLDMSAIRLTLTAVGIDPYKANHKTTHRVYDCIDRDIHDWKNWIQWVQEHNENDINSFCDCGCVCLQSLSDLFESEDDE